MEIENHKINSKSTIESYVKLETERENRRSIYLGVKIPSEQEKLNYIEKNINSLKIYPTYDDLYKEYKFFKYYFFTDSLIGICRTLNLNEDFKYASTYHFEKYKHFFIEGYEKYIRNDYTINDSHKEKYINEFSNIESILTETNKLPTYSIFQGGTPEFIEEMKNPLDPEKHDFNEALFNRWILFSCWNRLNKREIIEIICSGNSSLFLHSTKKVLGEEKCKEYLNEKYQKKEDLLESLFENFIFDNWWEIEKMKNYKEGFFTYKPFSFDYNLVCEKEIFKSLRIIENEMRLDLGQKSIGSFYNENILFKTIKNNFGNKFKVISQASPDWLKPQRFDIYFPEINLAIEYQGEQHFRPVDFGGKGLDFSQKQFELNKNRDELKKIKCIRNNCILLEMTFKDDINEFIKIISLKINMIEKNRV